MAQFGCRTGGCTTAAKPAPSTPKLAGASCGLCGALAGVVILDNAKFHHALLHRAWRTQVAPRFELDFLPPCSLELNPIERVWKLTRRSCLHNRYFEQLSELIHDVEHQFDAWRRGNGTLWRLCANI